MDIGDVLEEIDKKLVASSTEEQPEGLSKCLKIIIKLLVVNCANCPQVAKHILAREIIEKGL